MKCFALIIDETVSVKGIVGKKKLRECRRMMYQEDPYTYKCRSGHIRRTDQYSIKGYELFYGIVMVHQKQESYMDGLQFLKYRWTLLGRTIH